MSDIKKLTPFDYINMINSKSGRHDMEEISSGFDQYIVNKAMSNNLDSLYFAHEMNQYQIDKQWLFDFYYFGLDKKKRYGKWFKRDAANDDHINLIKEYFSYSTQKALDIYPMIIDSIDEIRTALYKGGASKRGK